jgi:hypothetical protein
MHPRYTWLGHSYAHGPSRIIWFLVGAASTFCWMSHKEMRANGEHIAARYCIRKPIKPPPHLQSPIEPEPSPQTRTFKGWTPPSPLQSNWSFGQVPPYDWEAERERMLETGRHIGEAVCFLLSVLLVSRLTYLWRCRKCLRRRWILFHL